MNIKKSTNLQTINTQIVVIGGGGSGLSAALSAAEKGAKVVLLEKRSKLGGTSAMAQGLFGAESSVQKRLKIDARRDELFKMAMKFAHWSIDPRIVRAFIDKSGDTINWLEGKGLTFDVPPYYPNQVPVTWHRIKEKGAGAKLIKLLAEESKALGARLLCNTMAKSLLTNEDGKISGVLAVSKGQQIKINTGGVIIATGGYGGNKKLLRKYCPYYNENINLIGMPNMGDGLSMALKAGAATEGLGILQAEAALHVTGGPKELLACSMEPDAIWVNMRGERFMDEAVTTQFDVFNSAQAVIRQPDSISYTLLDEAMVQRIINIGPNKVYGPEMWGPGVPQPNLGKALLTGVGYGGVKISDSWDEIAEWIGADPEIIKNTVKEYNSFCDNGRDAIYAKERRYLTALRIPPYYALRCHPIFIGTIGGIKINHNMQVLDNGGNPITGLYAVGVDAGGWEPETYNATLSGSTFGFAINSGRIAGEHLAKYMIFPPE